jgi:hypothetical protein
MEVKLDTLNQVMVPNLDMELLIMLMDMFNLDMLLLVNVVGK